MGLDIYFYVPDENSKTPVGEGDDSGLAEWPEEEEAVFPSEMFEDIDVEHFSHRFVDPEATLAALKESSEGWDYDGETAEWDYDGETLDMTGFRAHFVRATDSGEELIVEEDDPAMRWREVPYVRLKALRKVTYWGKGYGGGENLMETVEQTVGERTLFRDSEISRICDKLRQGGQEDVASAIERRAKEYPNAVIEISW